MPDAVRTEQTAPAEAGQHRSPGLLTLNSDGRHHPVLNALSVAVFVVGLVAFALGLVVSAHMVATAIGIASFAGGLGAQLYSATREQRILIITGIIAGFVGMALGVGHGGFS